MAEPSSETPIDSQDGAGDESQTRSRWAPKSHRDHKSVDELTEESFADPEEFSDEYESEVSYAEDSHAEDSHAEASYDSYAEDSYAEDSYAEDLSEEEVPRKRPRKKEKRAPEASPEDALRAATRYKLTIFILLGVAGLLTLGGAVRFWLPPWAPLAIFVIFGVTPVLFWSFVGSFLFDPSKARDGVITKNSPRFSQRLKLALAPVVAAGLLGALFAGLWYVPPVRAFVANVSATQRLHATLDSALIDEHESVRLAACEGLRDLKDDTSMRLLQSLKDPSDAVADCALEAIPPFPEAPIDLIGAANGWHTELMSTEPIDGDRACVLSNRMRVADRKGLKTATMHLLDCALTSPSDPAAQCCAQSFRTLLGGNDVEAPMVMKPANELLHRGFVKTLPALLEATHSDEPAWEQKRVMLRLDTPASKAWAMSIGCEALNYGGVDQRERISGMMAKAASSDSCQIGPAQETTVRLWEAVCSRLYSADSVASAGGDEDEQFCRAISSTLQVDARNEAQRAVREAMRNGRTPGRRAQMMKALLNYGGRVARAMQENGGNAFGGAMGDMDMDDAGMFIKPNGTDDGGSMFGDMMKMMLPPQARDGRKGGGRGKGQKGNAPSFEELIMEQAAKDLQDVGVDADPNEILRFNTD